MTAILGTKDGIKALAKFIACTGAFTKTGDLSQQADEELLWPDPGVGTS